MGGCGKTTVALEIAAHATAQVGRRLVGYRGRPAHAERGHARGGRLPRRSADLIERAWSGRTSATDLLWRMLAGAARPWLLVVDNADEPENLAPAAGYLAEGTGWIRPCAGLPGMVLVTTRDGNQATMGFLVGPASRGRPRRARRRPGAASTSRATRRAHAPTPSCSPVSSAGCHSRCASRAPISARRRPTRTGPARAPSAATPPIGPPWTIASSSCLNANPPGGGAVMGSTAPPIGQTWELSLDLLERRGIDPARRLMRLLSCLGEAPVPFLCLLRPDRLASSELLAGLTADRLSAALLALGDLGLIRVSRGPRGPRRGHRPYPAGASAGARRQPPSAGPSRAQPRVRVAGGRSARRRHLRPGPGRSGQLAPVATADTALRQSPWS